MQVLISSLRALRRLDQFDREEELDGADEETAQVERQGKGAERQRHFVNHNIFLRADHLELLRTEQVPHVIRGGGGYLEQEYQRKERKEERYQAQETQGGQALFDARSLGHVHETSDV